MSDAANLTRRLSLTGAIAVNVANMIGTGVFLKSRVMTCNVGDGRLVLLVWVVAGLLALAGTFVYSELAAMMPQAGGDYVYLRRAYGPFAAFLNGWTNLLARSASQAALAMGLAIFLNVALAGALDAPVFTLGLLGHERVMTALPLVGLVTIAVVTWLNCASIAGTGATAIVLTLVKVALVLLVAAVAFSGQGDFTHLLQSGAAGTCEGVTPSARGGAAGFGAAMLGALWAYDGWNNVAPLIGELKDPDRNAPRAFVGGTLVVGALYVLVNVGFFYVLTPTEIASVSATSSVAGVMLVRFIGPLAVTLMAVALMVSSFGALHASVLAGARVSYAMAHDGLYFAAVDRLSRRQVPVRSVLLLSGGAAVLILLGSYDTLTDLAMFASWIFFALTGLALFRLRRREPGTARPYRAWGYPLVPALYVAMAGAILVNTFVATPQQALQSVGALLVGVPFYAYWSRRRPDRGGA